MNCWWIQKRVLRALIRALSHARGALWRSLETESAERSNSHRSYLTFCNGDIVSSIPIPIRATDLKTQSSWSLNWSCWSVKNASFTEQLQGAYLNSKHYVPALLKLFFFFNFWFSKLQKGLFFIQFRLNFFSYHKIQKSFFCTPVFQVNTNHRAFSSTFCSSYGFFPTFSSSLMCIFCII